MVDKPPFPAPTPAPIAPVDKSGAWDQGKRGISCTVALTRNRQGGEDGQNPLPAPPMLLRRRGRHRITRRALDHWTENAQGRDDAAPEGTHPGICHSPAAPKKKAGSGSPRQSGHGRPQTRTDHQRAQSEGGCLLTGGKIGRDLREKVTRPRPAHRTARHRTHFCPASLARLGVTRR